METRAQLLWDDDPLHLRSITSWSEGGLWLL